MILIHTRLSAYCICLVLWVVGGKERFAIEYWLASWIRLAFVVYEYEWTSNAFSSCCCLWRWIENRRAKSYVLFVGFGYRDSERRQGSGYGPFMVIVVGGTERFAIINIPRPLLYSCWYPKTTRASWIVIRTRQTFRCSGCLPNHLEDRCFYFKILQFIIPSSGFLHQRGPRKTGCKLSRIEWKIFRLRFVVIVVLCDVDEIEASGFDSLFIL